MIEFLRRLFAQRQLPTATKAVTLGQIEVLGVNAEFTSKNFTGFVQEGYRGNPYVYACVKERGLAVAGIPWQLFRKSAGELTQIDEHDLLKLLKRPSKYQGGASFFEALMGFWDLDGNAYIYRVAATESGPPDELALLRPDRVKAKFSGTDIIHYEYELDNGKLLELPAEEILHIHTFNPLQMCDGISLLNPAMRSVDQSNSARAWNLAIMQNAGRPSGAFISEGQIDEEQYQRLKTELAAHVQGPHNAGKIRILEGGMRWEQLGMTPSDVDWINGQNLTAKEIALSFGVPPELIGDSANKTYSNYQEARKSFYTETILPLMDTIEDELNNWLTPFYGDDLVLKYDQDSIEAIQSDRAMVFQTAMGAYQSGLLTLNEARDLAGYEAVNGGDDFRQEPSLSFNDSGDDDDEPEQASKSAEAETKHLEFFNLQDASKKEAFFRKFDMMRNRFNEQVAKQVARRFRSERKAILKRIEGVAGVRNIADAVEAEMMEQRKAWTKTLAAIHVAVGEDFALDLFRDVQRNQFNTVEAGIAPPETKSLQEMLDNWKARVIDWIEKQGANKVVQITSSSAKAIRKELVKGVEAGEGIDDIADRIDSLYIDNFERARSVRIARTEVISASNLGSQQAAVETGLPLKKEWLTSIDGREREIHGNANGQVKGMTPVNEPYNVGGQNLLFPGDTSQGAGPGNVVNCRCTETYEVVRPSGVEGDY